MKRALVLIFMVGCGPARQKPAINAALSNAELRPSTFEATARSLDEHPNWIDEFYKVARKHPKLMHRFLQNAARDLREEALARETGELLSENPDSLQQVLIATVDASKNKPKARAPPWTARSSRDTWRWRTCSRTRRWP